jgi:polysaccharide pyruvyl transferase WcaK-like protein
MKRVAFFGSVGFNIGDEAIAVSSAYNLKKFNPDLEIYISTTKKGTIEGVYEGLKEFYLDRKTLKGWYKLLKFIKSVDYVFIGGGGMIQDKLGISLFRGMLPYVYQIVTIAKLFNKKVYTLPIGVDKLETKKGLMVARKVLKKVDLLWVRDNKSKEIAQEILGDHKREINVSADPAFLLEYELTPFNQCEYVCISLVKENLDTKKLREVLKECINWILENTSYHIVFVPMERRETDEISLFKDLLNEIRIDYNKALIKAKNEIAYQRVTILDPRNNVFEFIDILRSSKLLIAMRLHAMILSMGYTKILNISRTTKTETLSKEFGIPLIGIESINNETTKKIIDFIKNADSIDNDLVDVDYVLSEKKQILKNTFKSLGELLNDN